MASVTDQAGMNLRRDRLVITASALGTVFEWYDFFIYGTLASVIGRQFFPTHSEAAQFLLALASFAVGFGFRPVGAVLFGYLGDRLGRKYTFLVTITLMGFATAAIGLVPPYAAIGVAAPAIVILLRILQGLALGGEYGGAATYVVEHAPAHRRGFYTSFIQASVGGGFLLSLAVVLGTQAVMSEGAWIDWGWRVPFLISLLLLAISLWIRLKLSESPVFDAMKAKGDIARNPLKEAFADARNRKHILIALFGLAAGMTVIWYTAQFQALYFLQNSLKVEESVSRILVGGSAVISLFWFVLFGWLSDKVGRKKPILIGYAATLLLLFPLFHMIADAANPALAEATRRSPVVVAGSDCSYNPFAKVQQSGCGKLLHHFATRGVSYSTISARAPAVSIGGERLGDITAAGLDVGLAKAGYRLEPVIPSAGSLVQIMIALSLLGMLAGLTYGPAAALFAELFPSRVRYSSLSIPYHIGTGYFGGFLPFVSQYIIATTGDPFAGLWYTFAVTAVALIVTLVWLPETVGKPLD